MVESVCVIAYQFYLFFLLSIRDTCDLLLVNVFFFSGIVIPIKRYHRVSLSHTQTRSNVKGWKLKYDEKNTHTQFSQFSNSMSFTNIKYHFHLFSQTKKKQNNKNQVEVLNPSPHYHIFFPLFFLHQQFNNNE